MTATQCDHTVTQGREGEESSYCMACGIEVMAVHDRPCGECRHFRLDIGARVMGTCGPNLMTVTSNMRVSYYVDGLANALEGRPGLCFEERRAEATTGTPAVNPTV